MFNNRSFELLELLPGAGFRPPHGTIKLVNNVPSFVACAIYIPDGGQATVAAEPVQGMLKSLRHEHHAQYLWIEQVCLGGSAGGEPVSHKPFYMAAQAVMVWAGNDDEQDSFRPYLGPGTPSTTSAAFAFATVLASKEPREVPQALSLTFHQTGVPLWAYFLRICCRDFYREAPFLKTNYRHEINKCVVRCGEVNIDLAVFEKAAYTIRAMIPTPMFMGVATQADMEQADRGLAASLIRFGFEPLHVLKRIQDALNQPRNATRLARHLAGSSNDLYQGDDVASDGWAKVDHGLTMADANPQALAVYRLATHPIRAPPTLPCRPDQARRLAVADQAAFVGNIAVPRSAIPLITIWDAPINGVVSCGFQETALEPDKVYVAVTNHPAKLSRSAKILLNGQSFILAKSYELLLRLVGLDNPDICLYLPAVFPPVGGQQAEASMPAPAHTMDVLDTILSAGNKMLPEDMKAAGLPDGSNWEEWIRSLHA